LRNCNSYERLLAQAGLTLSNYQREISSITHQQTRLGIQRAIRYTATHIPKCKLLPGKPERQLARQFAAHAPATTVGGTPAATPGTQKTTEERDFRGIAAEEPEEEEPEIHLPPEAQHRGSRRSGAMDTSVPATLVRPQRQAGIYHLER